MYKTYEYLAIDIYDKWGKSDINRINQELNLLGAEGWRLVTAYTNELGKNALSIGSIGINSTADQNVFIFEKEVYKETPEEIEQKKLAIQKELELQKQKEKEELESNIEKFKASNKFIFSEQESILRTFKTASEITEYLKKLDLDDDFFKNTIIPEIEKISQIERFYGNRYENAISKLAELTQ